MLKSSDNASDNEEHGVTPGPGQTVENDDVRVVVAAAAPVSVAVESLVEDKGGDSADGSKGDGPKNDVSESDGDGNGDGVGDTEIVFGEVIEETDNGKETKSVAVGEPLPTSPAVGVPDEEFKLKHPLQNTWTLWYLENDRTKSWEEMQNEITSFDTVEDFWSLYNFIKPPSEIKMGSDYSLFKKNIRPMWEDSANKHGGRWVITLPKSCKVDLDNLWLDVLLCLIGEAFDHSDQVCGAVVNIRGKNNKISIWTSNGNMQDAAMEIGRKLRDALCLERHNYLQYQLHTDTMIKQGSNVKSIYTL